MKKKIKIQELLEPYIKDKKERLKVAATITLLFGNDIAKSKIIKANIQKRIDTLQSIEDRLRGMDSVKEAMEIREEKIKFQQLLQV